MYDGPDPDMGRPHWGGHGGGGVSVPLRSSEVDAKRRRGELAQRLGDLFLTSPLEGTFSPWHPLNVAPAVGSSQWSRQLLKAFADVRRNGELIDWAQGVGLPGALAKLSSTSEGEPQFTPIFEALHELHGTAFRWGHLSEYRQNRLARRGEVRDGFVGPYGMPAIGGALPLLSGLIAADRYPDLLDPKQPEVKKVHPQQAYARRPHSRHSRYL